MSRLIRMDHTGHTELARWSPDDPEAVEAAVTAFRAELDRGYYGMVSTGEGHAEQVRELPPDPLTAEPLPELALVPWRPRVDGHRLDRAGALWTLTTIAHVVPFVATA